jgi:NADH-quinone oxidoreductase subunit L
MTFHCKELMDRHTWDHLHESPAVVWVPLAVLAIPSLIIGAFLIGPMLFKGYFGDAIVVASQHDVLAKIGEDYHGIISFTLHAFKYPPVYLAFAGLFVAWLFYIKFPALPERIANIFKPIYQLLLHKCGLDDLNQFVFAGGTRNIGKLLWQIGDVKIIDGLIVNGSAQAVRWFSGVVRHVQSGYLYHYAFTMIIGLLLLMAIFVHKLN